jgi:hypothetical protein
MSYSRYTDECSLYIWRDSATNLLTCSWCELFPDQEWFQCGSREEMIAHVQAHEAVGHVVGGAIESLRAGDFGEQPLMAT